MDKYYETEGVSFNTIILKTSLYVPLRRHLWRQLHERWKGIHHPLLHAPPQLDLTQNAFMHLNKC
uniref:Uncharacterized protein n=1 Tax=Medicago truncatula TaxID=3880 RepID=I3T0H9_MEDTR|nr:unknown [Medicago truncatula]